MTGVTWAKLAVDQWAMVSNTAESRDVEAGRSTVESSVTAEVEFAVYVPDVEPSSIDVVVVEAEEKP